MKRIWLASYPPGVPPEVDTDGYASLAEMFDRNVARFAGLPAFSNLGRTLTFAETGAYVAAFAAFLHGRLGLARGDRIAVMLPNLLQHPVVTFGALRAGCVVVNVNPLYTARELQLQLADSGAVAIVVLENFAHVLADVLDRTAIRHVVTTAMGDLLEPLRRHLVNFTVRHLKRAVPPYHLPGAIGLPAALADGARLTHEPPRLSHDDLAFLQYTGGTTGGSKAAMLTHGNLVANVEQIAAWLHPYVGEGQELIITALPLYHVFALTANCLVFVRIGGCNHLITDPRDLAGFVRELARLRFTGITGVNTLFRALLDTPGFAELDFGTLKMALGGGMAVQRAVAKRWHTVTGSTLIEAYGLTEASPAVCMNPLDLAHYNGKIGLPIPSTECAIRAPDGRELPPGEAGELCVRGPQVMRGYWNRREETRAVLDADGWLHTGDIGRMDAQGYIEIVDRKKDLILVSGFNVYPNEIEEVVAAHPDVLEVAAVGVPDPDSGEAIKLFVVPRSEALEQNTLIAWCRRNLTGYKIPRYVEFRGELPKSPVGKILRRSLREQG